MCLIHGNEILYTSAALKRDEHRNVLERSELGLNFLIVSVLATRESIDNCTQIKKN